MSIPDVDIPEDALVEILVRLPVKYLLKFRCVSKSWYSLISSPQFISAHTHFTHIRPKKPDLLLVGSFFSGGKFSLRFDDQSFREYRELSFPEEGSHVWVHGFCQGLVCLFRCEIGDKGDKGWIKTFVIWNPTLGISLALPIPSLKEPRNFHYPIGFGFDAKRNDYKVIWIPFNDRCPPYAPRQYEVFELSRNAWRVVSPSVTLPYICPLICPVFFNGFVHWIGGLHKRTIVAFDFADEAFHEMNLPVELESVDPTRLRTLVKERSYLSVICSDLRNKYAPTSILNIWVMKEYGVEESWSKLFKIQFPNLWEFLFPVGFRTNGEVVGRKNDYKLASYDCCTSSVTCLGHIGEGYPIGFAVDHIETLDLLQVRGAEIRQ